jgi:hypothetical protein
MVMFNSYVGLPEGRSQLLLQFLVLMIPSPNVIFTYFHQRFQPAYSLDIPNLDGFYITIHIPTRTLQLLV